MAVLPVGIGPETSYNISRSLRFNSADSTSLSKTYSTSKTSNTTVTFSFWIKRSVLGVFQSFFSGYDGSSAASFQIGITSGNIMHIDYGGSASVILETTQVFRDVSSWYHFVVSIDTTQATSSNRIKVYVNGAQVTSFSAAAYPSLNQSLQFALTNANNRIGSYWNGGNLSNGYLTEVNFIDGQALTPSSFGETDPITGVWKPKKYTGTYGTNGFYLNFSDNSGTTATTLGKDYSGNGNNWTPNNFSVTAGAGNDSLVDVPTLWGSDTGAGGEVRGNYCTLNAVDNLGMTLSNGNLQAVATTFDKCVRATITIPTSGKWYWEILDVTQGFRGKAGLASISRLISSFTTSLQDTILYAFWAGVIQKDGSTVATYTSMATNDIAMFAIDADSGKIWVGRNGTWFNSGAPASGTGNVTTLSSGVSYAPFFYEDASVGDGVTTTAWNFGQRPFAYTAPSGFKALCTTNLPDPSIKQGDDYFNAVLYTGTGSSLSVTGVGFQPDLVWTKERSTALNHGLYDVVRGATKGLASNTTDAEYTEAQSLTSFNADGFTVGTWAGENVNGTTYVAWNWKANGTGVSNTDGTITSTVSANTTSGFSIVTYTGTNAAATVGHGLGVAPKMIIVRNRSDGTVNWRVYHTSIGATNYLSLNLTNASAAASSVWNNTTPTSTVFSVANDGGSNGSTNNMVAYCFAEVAGFSAFGSFVGNGSSTDGPYVHLGFRPAFVLIKNSSIVQSWSMYDNERPTYNAVTQRLLANSSGAEETRASTDVVDFTANGFKVRSDQTIINGNGNTHIYMAFAENPFKYSLAR